MAGEKEAAIITAAMQMAMHIDIHNEIGRTMRNAQKVQTDLLTHYANCYALLTQLHNQENVKPTAHDATKRS